MREVGRLLVMWAVCGVIASAPNGIFAQSANQIAGEIRPAKINCLYVTPAGPTDGGDFGPNTPGTKTSGLQEAFDAAKAQGKDLYISGGSWTADKTKPIVYVLTETVRVPWMQDFRCDSGICVIHHAGKKGEAIVFDSQMSCHYRLGIIVNEADDAVVRVKPSSKGPDRFSVVTTTEFHINALVGGGGAWPGGEAYATKLDPKKRWIGMGLCLDASQGPIDSNIFDVVEIVGCNQAIKLTGPVTHNRIECTFAHLSNEGVVVGDDISMSPGTNQPSQNRFKLRVDGEGIEGSKGAVIWGRDNLFDLIPGRASKNQDVIFEASSENNLVVMTKLPNGWTNLSKRSTNRIQLPADAGMNVSTPACPKSGEICFNREAVPAMIEFYAKGGNIRSWTEVTAQGKERLEKPFSNGPATLILNPGEGIKFDFEGELVWRWKGIF